MSERTSITDYVRAILEELPEHIRERVIIAGGCLRAFYDGTTVKDYDLFFRSVQDYLAADRALADLAHSSDSAAWIENFDVAAATAEFISPTGKRFNLVGFAFGEVEEQLSRFDFLCCAMAAWQEPNGMVCFVPVEGSIEDATAKRLTVRVSNGDERTLRRIARYENDYGYAVDLGDTAVPLGTREAVLRQFVASRPRGGSCGSDGR